MCPPGVQDGSKPPSGSATVNATTSGATSSRSVTTAVCVRRTGFTRDGCQREVEANPPNKTRMPHTAVPRRSRLLRQYRAAGLLAQMVSDTVRASCLPNVEAHEQSKHRRADAPHRVADPGLGGDR